MKITEVVTEYIPKKNDIGLMTREEFLDYKNPQGIGHESDSYDFDMKRMNRDHMDLIFTYHGNRDYDQIYKNNNGFIFTKDDKIVAFVTNDTLYYGLSFAKNSVPVSFVTRNNEEYSINPKKFKQVKYLDQYVELIFKTAEKNINRYPNILRRLKIKNEDFTVRIEGAYKEDSGDTIVILNSSGYIVAQASDEWGATLLTVVQEYRGFGLGKIIGKFWYDMNPSYKSGGFTPAGQRNALSIWSDRVRQFISNGWYSQMIKDGELSKKRVREIISGVSEKYKKELLEPVKEEPIVYLDDHEFIIYDKKFLDVQDENYIYGFGFFREYEDRIFLYRLDYEPKYKKIATYIALQLAKNNGDQIYVGGEPSDIIEYENLEGVNKDGDFISLKSDVIDLSKYKRQETGLRKQVDPYDEIYYTLQELANGKWT